jgi:Protein of unknown function (DUF998)
MFFYLFIIVIAYLIAGIVYEGAKKPSYSHIQHTISELGEITYTRSAWVSWGLFLPVGISFILLGLWGAKEEATQGIAVCLGVGYVVAAVFPCDEGSPMEGSWRQGLHNVGGAIEYIGSLYFVAKSNVSFLQGNISTNNLLYGIIFCIIIISIPSLRVRGLFQRILEAMLMCVVVSAFM